ncbi:hypothetical protein SAMN05192540_3944 [Maribacter dokdonensis]|uniref:Uncharacterized protein n=1 Tax=Maribacter dokdonensis TaxID=320912 RepID=A0A1H4UXS0_9FLAO|nr:hypothetical protein SAMN05192540_3944 [Maribacter dokdonensis]
MKSMLLHKLNKGLSSSLNWMTKYRISIYFQSHSAHSPIFRACLPKKPSNHFIFGKRASLPISWTQYPISAFHSVNPYRPDSFRDWEETLHSRAKIVNRVRFSSERLHFGFLNGIFGTVFLSPHSKIPKNQTVVLYILRGL